MKRLHRTLLQAGAVVAASALIAACSSSSGGGHKGKSGKSSLTFSYSNAVPQLEKVPLHLALQNLDKQGISTKESFHQNGQDAIEAVTRGESDFGTSNAASVFAAIKKGVPIQAIMTAYYPAYLLVAPTSVSDPAGLDGKRVGIQSKVSSTTLYTDLALNKAPSAKPKILVVPGSANRVQAMIAGQLDASVVQFADWLTLQQKAPGKFHVIYDVAQENPDLIDSVIFANTKTLKSDPDYVKKFLAAVQDEYKTVYNDPAKLAHDIASVVPKMTEQNATQLAQTAIKDKIWPADGGFGADKINATLDALKSAGLVKADKLPSADQCCSDKFLSTPSGG